MSESSSQTVNPSNLENEIQLLRTEISELKKKTTPDSIAKAVDSSYLSVNNLRTFLQILALILTVFLAGVSIFAVVGITNILKIREEAEKIREESNKVQTTRESVQKTQREVQADAENIHGALANALQRFETAKVDLEKDFEKTLQGVKAKSDGQLSQLQHTLEEKTKTTDEEVGRVNARLADISKTFNKVAVANEETLNAREKQLLFLLAKEIDPINPLYNYNAASMAFEFRRYDEALRYLDAVLSSQQTPAQLQDRAKELKTACDDRKAHPVEVKTPSQGLAIGGYYPMALHVNTLNMLFQNGLITYEQGQKVIDDAKAKFPEKK